MGKSREDTRKAATHRVFTEVFAAARVALAFHRRASYTHYSPHNFHQEEQEVHGGGNGILCFLDNGAREAALGTRSYSHLSLFLPP